MKLWVADGVLEDYTSGICVIYANSEQEAITKLYEKDSTAFFVLYNNEFGECDCENYKGDKAEHRYNIHRPKKLPSCFKLITSSSAYAVWGGG